MRRERYLPFLLLVSTSFVWSAERYPVSGLVLKVNPEHKAFVASCAEIRGYMDAMTMPYTVRDVNALDGLKPGTYVDFTLVVEKDDSHAENIRVHKYINAEQEPMRAQRLQLMERLENQAAAPVGLAVGEPVPDFALTDQAGKPVTLSEFAGKVVGLTFIYTSCPLPNYCYRMSNNFGRLKNRFADRMGKDLILLSITFDPIHDQPDILAKYAANWKADPNTWHFLTGPLDDVRAICRRFGLNYWPDEGLLTHSLHTVIIDRQGRLTANLEGNEFSAEQLGDLVEATMRTGANAPER
jgi:protein SCO1/2